MDNKFKYNNVALIVIIAVLLYIVIAFENYISSKYEGSIFVRIFFALLLFICIYVYIKTKNKCEKIFDELDKKYNLNILNDEINDPDTLLFYEERNKLFKGKIYITKNYLIYINNERSYAVAFQEIERIKSSLNLDRLEYITGRRPKYYEMITVGYDNNEYVVNRRMLNKDSDEEGKEDYALFAEVYKRLDHLIKEKEKASIVYYDTIYQSENSIIIIEECEINKIKYDDIENISFKKKTFSITIKNDIVFEYDIDLTEKDYYDITLAVSNKNILAKIEEYNHKK